MSRKVAFRIFFALGTGFCTSAGIWQLRRKKWKEDLIATRSRYLLEDPIEISLPLPEKDLNFHPVKLKGKFDHNKEMLLLRKYGEATGYRVITPFYVGERQGLMVNRGWVPTSLKDFSSRPEASEEVWITGVIRNGESASKYTPSNSPRLGEWYYIELPLMSKICEMENKEASEVLLQEVNWDREREVYDEEEFREMPVKSVRKDLIYWYVMPYTHASYASFWFGTAAICFYFMLIMRRI